MDLRMLFKITHNLVALDFCSFFGLTNYTSPRGQNYKLVKPICHNNARQFLFACIDEYSLNNLLKSCCLDGFVTLG